MDTNTFEEQLDDEIFDDEKRCRAEMKRLQQEDQLIQEFHEIVVTTSFLRGLKSTLELQLHMIVAQSRQIEQILSHLNDWKTNERNANHRGASLTYSGAIQISTKPE